MRNGTLKFGVGVRVSHEAGSCGEEDKCDSSLSPSSVPRMLMAADPVPRCEQSLPKEGCPGLGVCGACQVR